MEELNSCNSYQIIRSDGFAEVVEKKSRFIANIRQVISEEEAVNFIEEMKKQYWDAKHNCSAFVIGNKGQLTRCSDDGEPSGTAGRPMLEVLLGEEIRNVAVVVTRYFGGTLLGTGGLVRAYSEAVKKGLETCDRAVCRYGIFTSVETDYNGAGRIRYLLEQKESIEYSAEYAESVKFNMIIPIEEFEMLKNEITEATMGKALILEKQKKSFVDKKSLK